MGRPFAVAALAFFVSFQCSGWSQVQEREKTLEAEAREAMDPELKPVEGREGADGAPDDVAWDWGGFSAQYLINAEDGSGVYRANRYESHYLWTRMNYTQNLGLYVRLKNFKRETRRGDHPGGDHTQRDNVKLDVGYLSLSTDPSDVMASLQAGRYFVSHGSGITLIDSLDGARADFSCGNVSGFVHRGRTPESRHNQNAVAPGWYHSKRYFTGGELEWSGPAGWRPYGGYVQERDHSDERPRDRSQGYHSDFNFSFVGLRGELTPIWKISGEHIWQDGRVPKFGSNGRRQPQSSNAYIISSRVLQEDVAVYEYDWIYARGDNDRRSVTSMGNGTDSRIGRSDHNFFYFGHVDTGLAYAPRISNMVIHHAGATFHIPELPHWQAKLDLFNFRRDVSHTVNSDPYITRHGAHLGREVDLGLEFRPFSNFSLSADYGMFLGGRSHGTQTDSSPRREYFGFSCSVDF